MMKRLLPLLALCGALALATPGAAEAQTPEVSATVALNPTSTLPSTTVTATFTFTPNGPIGAQNVAAQLLGTGGEGTFVDPAVSTSSGLSACVFNGLRVLDCDWNTALDQTQTIVLTINVGAGAQPASWPVQATGAPDGDFKAVLAAADLVIDAVAPPTTAPPTTAPPTTAPPTTAPPTTAPPTTTATSVPPTTVAPTAPATTIAPGGPSTELPATGSGLAWVMGLIAALLVGLGLIARRTAHG